ncbi:MAG: aminotransferase class I/II-fold pyridoxal phosphate-dependent enzyme [Dehalococcoidia bacterium]
MPPGARYPLHASGLAAPDLALTLPDDAWRQPSAAVLEPFTGRLTALLGVPGAALVSASGAGEAVFLALAPFAERGRPVVVEQPAYRAMEQVVRLLGVSRSALSGGRRTAGGSIRRGSMPCWLQPARRSSVSPTRTTRPAPRDAAQRAEVVRVVERRGALLVVDEIFAPFRGAGAPPAWASLSDRVLTVGSLTKAWGLGSLRSGWVIGAAPLVARCEAAHELVGGLPPTMTLALSLVALDHATALDARAHAAARTARAAFAATAWGQASMRLPDDGIVGFLRLPPGWSSLTTATALRDLDGVQTGPGRFFGGDGYLRLGISLPEPDAVEACRLVAARLNGAPPPASS